MKKESAFKMKGFGGFGTEESPAKKTIKYGEKSYTKKDPEKSYMGDKSRSEFGLYKAGMGPNGTNMVFREQSILKKIRKQHLMLKSTRQEV